MTFSLTRQSLCQSENEAYLRLMTTLILGVEKKYQFYYLSFQELLGAWPIAKYEKTKEVFTEHFDNGHLRMCPMFEPDLTHLQHESYQLCFNKELDLQCKRRPLIGLHKCYSSHLRKN